MLRRYMDGSRRHGLPLLLILVVAACSSTESPSTEPTQTLVPPTLTHTVVPVTPTTFTTPLPRPGDIDTPPPSSDELSVTPIDDFIAAELVLLAQRRLAQDLDVPVRRIRVVELTSYTWPDTSLGCPSPDEVYPQAQVEGYRIVLAVNEQEYIFHTDFDRVIACDPANVRLPEIGDS